jgi:hypothetical protein
MGGAFRQNYSFTIVNGASLGSTVDFGNAEFGGNVTGAVLFSPSGWDVAALTAQVSLDGSTWVNLVSSGGTEVSVASALTASTAFQILGSSAPIGQTRYLRFRSGTGAAPVVQTADRTFTLLVSRSA